VSLLRYPVAMVPPPWPSEQGRPLPTPWPALPRGSALRLVLLALAITLILWLFVSCAAAQGLLFAPQRM